MNQGITVSFLNLFPYFTQQSEQAQMAHTPRFMFLTQGKELHVFTYSSIYIQLNIYIRRASQAMYLHTQEHLHTQAMPHSASSTFTCSGYAFTNLGTFAYSGYATLSQTESEPQRL